MKKGLLWGLICMVLVLTGCGSKDSKDSESAIEKAKKSSNSVICTQTKKMNYYDIEALKEQEAGTYQEGLKDMPDYADPAEREAAYAERERKRAVDAGTFTKEYIYEFNKAGNQIENVYLIVTSDFNHDEVTDSMLKANKDYLDSYYKDSDEYTSYKITIDGKKVIRELTYNMDKIEDRNKLSMSKEQLILQASYTSKDGNSNICVAN